MIRHRRTYKTLNGYLARHGWVSDPIEHGDYCCDECLKKAARKRKPIEEIERL